MKVKPISEIIGAHRDNVKVALDAVQSKLKPLNQSIAILKDEEHEMKVGNLSATVWTTRKEIGFRSSKLNSCRVVFSLHSSFRFSLVLSQLQMCPIKP